MFAVVRLPGFRLQAALCASPAALRQPVALIDDGDGRDVVLEVSPAAEAAGVLPGLPSVQALARCPRLRLLPRAPADERSAQAHLMVTAGVFSADVEATAAGCCTLDWRRAHFSDWERRGHDIVAHLAPHGLRACVGVAPNPDLAFLAARRAAPVLVVTSPDAFLTGLPLAALDPPPALLEVLRDWGIRTLGQFTALPRGEVAARLGPEADRLWQRAAGEAERLLVPVRPPAEYLGSFDFEHGIETLEPLLFILRRLLGSLVPRVQAAHRCVGKMILTLPLENGAVFERPFLIPSPTTDEEVLFRVLHTHLDGRFLDHRPVGVRLRLDPVSPDRQQFCLFESPLRDPNRFGETLAELAALLGNEAVGVPRCHDTHRPRAIGLAAPQFHHTNDAAASSPRRRGPSAESRSLPASSRPAIGLPLRWFHPRAEAEVRIERHEPAHVMSQPVCGAVSGRLGPYRVSGDWWDAGWSVEEWDIEVAGGGLYRIACHGGPWFIEGMYERTVC